MFALGILILISVWPQQFDRRNAIRKLGISMGDRFARNSNVYMESMAGEGVVS
jgi:hypothetical protein